jgi:hypothetical protein
MEVRRRALPPGWYPATGEECRREIEGYLAAAPRRPQGLEKVRGAIVPHAGWFFSGRLAAWAFAAAAAEGPEVVVIFGGHLGAGPPRVILEEAWETPLGRVTLARDLAGELHRRVSARREPAGAADNTIEVHLPMLRHLFPEARVLAARAPHTEEALSLGEEAARLCQEAGLGCAVFGSTDLTHYGPDYGFMPHGLGPRAERWVKEVNDARFVEAALALDGPSLLRLGAEEESACSAGAAAAAVAAGRRLGAGRGFLLGSYLSAEVASLGESFVGYAAVAF